MSDFEDIFKNLIEKRDSIEKNINNAIDDAVNDAVNDVVNPAKNAENIDKKDINPHIFDSKALIDDAVKILNDFQTGRLKPIKFRKAHINQALLGGLFQGTVMGLAGSSGHGKTTAMQEMEEDIFNKSLNPDCDDFVLLKNNYEMSVFKLFLRSLKNEMDIKIGELLGKEFTDEQNKIFEKIKSRESDPRIKYFPNPTDPTTWFIAVEQFIQDNQDKKHIIITIDHIALVKQTFAGKKDAIDNLIEYINLLKNKYNNVSFIILSQLNRNIEDRDNPKNSAPKKGDLYQSDFLYQLSDVILVVHMPYKFGLQEHMVIGQDMYPNLNEFKKDRSKKVTTFLTKGNIFYHYIKLREDENQTVQDLFIERMKKSEYRADYLNSDLEPELPKMSPNAELFDNYDSEDSVYN